LADDTSALFHNPAALVYLKGVRAKANLFLGAPTTSVGSLPSGRPLRSQPLMFRGSAALNWRFWKRASLGLGFFSPHNFETNWPYSWPGADICLTANYRPSFFRSALSVELFRGFSVGAGVDLVQSKLVWTHTLTFPRSPRISRDLAIESRQELDGRGTGFVGALHWKVHRAVRLGMSYQSGAAVDLAGRNVFITPSIQIGGALVPGPYGAPIRLITILNEFYPSQDVTARLTAPGQMTVGLVIAPFFRLSLLVDAQQTRWREFGAWEVRSKNDGGDLSPGFSQDYRDFYGIAPDYGIQSAGLKLRDVWAVKAGVEYRPSAHLALRSGFARQGGSSVPERLNPVYPDLDRNVVSLGFGYEGPLFSVYDNSQVSELSFDLFVRYGFSGEKASAVPGHEFTYGSRAWVGGVGVGFNF
jgi:long-subunit fatty acid transport protein